MENKQPYDEKISRAKNSERVSAEAVLSVVSDFIRPRSVVDVGCGGGTWLAAGQHRSGGGISIYGVDGDCVNRSQLVIDEKFFHPFDLEERVTLNRRFDLAMSIEVAEHLTPARADSFVEDLTHLSDVILFSAAIPGQGGTNHVNEQWQSYWAEKFLRLNYVAVDCIRPKVWYDNSVEICHRQNIFLYVKSSELHLHPELRAFYLKHRDTLMVDAVHPALYIGLDNFYQRIQNH